MESASFKQEASTTQHELSLQQQRGQVLQAKVQSISSELATQKQELKEMSISKETTLEKLCQAEKRAQQFQAESTLLKAEVRLSHC